MWCRFRASPGPPRGISASMPSSPARPEATTGQRGWKRHPSGTRVGSGGSPVRIGRSIPPASGTTSSRAFVYGCVGRWRTSSAGPISTMRPRYITATRSATVHARPEVVCDDQDREPEFGAELHEQREDLAADRRVQVRHRLVGDDHLRFEHERARRSPHAAAGPPRVRAGTAGRSARGAAGPLVTAPRRPVAPRSRHPAR